MQRTLSILSGLAALTAAALVFLAAGLPDPAAFAGVLADAESGRYVAPLPNAYAPPIDAQTLDGASFSLDPRRADGIGPLVVNFWATWCGPCRAEMPVLQSLHVSHADSGLRVIGVNTGEPPELAAAFAESLDLDFTLLLDLDGRVQRAYQLRATPTTLIIAPGGLVTQVIYGPVSEQHLLNALRPFLELDE